MTEESHERLGFTGRRESTGATASFLISLIAIVGLTVAMFADVLFATKQTVLSNEHTDLFLQFVFWRDFGFSQMRQGNLALWNPHIFSGAPFLGGFQSALLYPFNLVYLLMPLAKAINVTIAWHVFLAGIFMYFWAWYRRLHPLACFLSAVLIMFCGAHFWHIYAGHLANLCTMVWAPLVFLSIDALYEQRSFVWSLLGMFAVTMQILAGHPQYVFIIAVAGAIYSAFCFVTAQQRIRVAAGYVCIYLGAAAMGAVQLFTGIQASGETVRSIGLTYELASMFSFPPENLITLLAPDFFGTKPFVDYWGRCYLWEMCLFLSVTGLVLATYGAFRASHRVRRFSVWMVSILLVLALGAHTPVFKILYHWIPLFNKFRSMSKFIFPASLFITMLAAIGLDHLIRQGRDSRKSVLFVLVSGIAVTGLAFFIRHAVLTTDPGHWWQQIMQAVYKTKESYFPAEKYSDAAFVRQAGVSASMSLAIAAGKLFLLSFLLWLAKSWRKATYVIVILAVVEVCSFARSTIDTFDLGSTQIAAVNRLLAKNPGDYRILNTAFPNSAMSNGAQDLWGYDPGVLLRYAQFMSFTQGQDPDKATQYLFFPRFHELYGMLRGRFYFLVDNNKLRILQAENVMPRLQLIQEYRVITDRDKIFEAMADSRFDPRQTVILETLPDPEPIESDQGGRVSILDSSTDHLTIEGDLPSPAILLITDVYSKGWHVQPLPGSSQERYDILPANYVLRAVPLSKGHHHFRIEYLPVAFQIGRWVSIVSIVLYLGLLGRYCVTSQVVRAKLPRLSRPTGN